LGDITPALIAGVFITMSEDNSLERKPDSLTSMADPLKLELDDADLVKVVDQRKNDSKSYFNKTLKLTTRRTRNYKYLLGEQINVDDLKYYNARYVDNLIWEAEGTIKPIAMSRLPDLLVKPGNESDESKKTAEDLTSVVNSDIRKRENRRVLSLAFKHNPVFLVGVLKAMWDPQMGDDGDYRFKVVHPNNITMDHTSSTNNERDMDFIAEDTELSAKEITMRFQKKKDEFLKEAGLEDPSSRTEEKMASKYKICEIWFTWWKDSEDPDTGEMKWERIEGVVWKYKNLVLGKMKNPYWDWQGKKRLFRYEMGKKKQLTDDEMRAAVFGEVEGVESEMFYFNHFKDPAKPYYFMGYEQMGEHPMDVTSRIEQVLLMQDNHNKRGRQITEMNDRAKGKHVFSTESGLDKEDVENIDMANPDEDIVVAGEVNKVHTFIPGTPAPAQLYQEQAIGREHVFAKMSVHRTTRGEINPGKPGISDQIAREGDFGKIDDLVEETINPAAEWMSNWAMQFIKMFYTKSHMRKLLGRDGELTFAKINRDMIEDGMEVVVSASGVDKAERKREAFERARLKLTDPLTFFIDTDASDPVGRTEKLMTFLLAPELYVQEFVLKRDAEGMGEALNAEGVVEEQQPPQQVPQAQPAAMPPQGGGQVQLMSPAQQVVQGVGGGNSSLTNRS